MKVYHHEFKIKTTKKREIIDITSKVEDSLSQSKIKNGICLVFLPHATSALMLEEKESGLLEDIENFLDREFPKGSGYEHDRVDDNADAHIASGFIGQSRVYPVKDGELVRGTWQHALLIELDGPRERHVFITVIGE